MPESDMQNISCKQKSMEKKKKKRQPKKKKTIHQNKIKNKAQSKHTLS